MNGRSDLRRRAATLLAGVAAVVLTVGCVATRSDGHPQSSNDRLLSDRVGTALQSDPAFYFRHVDVRTDNGKVFLSGYVWSSDAIFRAERIANNVPGVSSVVDELELERNGSNGGGSSGAR